MGLGSATLNNKSEPRTIKHIHIDVKNLPIYCCVMLIVHPAEVWQFCISV